MSSAIYWIHFDEMLLEILHVSNVYLQNIVTAWFTSCQFFKGQGLFKGWVYSSMTGKVNWFIITSF